MKLRSIALLVTAAAALNVCAQAPAGSSMAVPDGPEAGGPNRIAVVDSLPTAPSPQVIPAYTPPSNQMLFRVYMFDAIGPYPIAGAFASAGLNQASNSPPEWGQGFQGYSDRVLSNYGISVSRTTSRYLLAKALKEDTLYYPCECRGVMPRVAHAALSAVTARSGADGHRVFSFAAVGATYAGTMVGIFGWYPRRYGIKDVARMGNYATLASVGWNISYEFLYSGPHALLARGRSARNKPGPNTPIEGASQ